MADDLLLQRGAELPARERQSLGARGVLREAGRGLLLHLVTTDIRGLQLEQFVGQALAVFQDVGTVAAVLPGQALDHTQPLLDPVESPGIRVGSDRPCPQIGRQIVHQRARLDQGVGPGPGLGLPARDVLQRVSGLSEPAVNRLIVVAEQGERPVQSARDRLGMAQHFPFGPQLLVLAGQEARGVDFRGLELEQVDPLQAKLIVAAQALEPIGRLAVGLVGAGARRHECRNGVAARPIEPGPLQFGRQHAEFVALTEDADQTAGHRGKKPQRHRVIVHEHAVAPRPGNLAAHQELVPFRRHAGLFEQPPPVAARRLEDAAQDQRVRARADRLRTGAPPGKQGQRIDHQGLARPRLARDHVQARSEVKLCPFDHGQVLNVQRAQHRMPAYRATRRTPVRRRVTRPRRSP